MSSNRFVPQFAPLRYDPSRAFIPFTPISRTELIAMNDHLDGDRRELLSNTKSESRRETAFVDLPERMLADYRQSRGRSELGRILAVGRRLRGAADRVVILAAGNVNLGARALFAAGCHPYHNELSRGDRGGRPRIYFAGNGFDNDAIQGLLDLLPHARPAANVEEHWAIIAIGNSFNAVESVPMLQVLAAALRDFCGDDADTAARLIVPIADAGSPLAELGAAIGCVDAFDQSGADGGCESVLAAAGLLPAAVMGLDVVRLLEGAAMMNERFRTAPPGDNPALDYAAVSHLFGSRPGTVAGRIVSWAGALEPAAIWSNQLQPVRGNREHEPAAFDAFGGLTTNLIVDSIRRDRLVVPPAEGGLGRQFPDLQSASLRSAREASAAERRPTADLNLPACDESALGQFFQMMLLAAAIERRLNGDCPYGQSASPAYKSQ